MTAVWIVVGVCALATFALRAAGPLVLGGRSLPPALERMLDLAAPALLAALVVINCFASGRSVVLDARAAGLAAAVVAIALKAPPLVTVAAAAGVTAALRAV